MTIVFVSSAVLCWTLVAVVLILPQCSMAVEPVQVYLLAGQSNMVGMGSIDHLDLLVSADDNEFRRTLWNGTQYRELSNVYMYYETRHGKLTVSRTAGYAGGNAFGPELMFGWTLATESSDTNRTILLIKVAYGGRCLAVDFRPPSAGTGNYSGIPPMHYGWEYRTMITDALEALHNIATIVPEYDPAVGYALAGFVWFQGWNDMLDWGKVNEYEENLVKFMRDVRLDVNAPSDLPFVVGELGMHGEHPEGRGSDRTLALRVAQRQACARDVACQFVPTAQYAVLNGTTYNGIYHYNGRADTYFYIGQAMGRAMIHLRNKTKPKTSVVPMKNVDKQFFAAFM